MIPKTVREGATAEGLEGERESFTIEANGKAFRTLIDGLYSNKIQAVCRELSSNAQDSHIAAGQTRPFEVSIPTSLDPVFRVRDFGTSLSHEDVMFLYTRIFKSTKENTNDQTGALGLGSKSPFAYTDTFSVVAYLNGERRVYVAFLETDGVPCITHVVTDATDEPNGLEVSFPARREDMSEFQTEMQAVALGHKPGTFVAHGMKVNLPEPRLTGEDWALYPTESMPESRRTMVRMGTVVYPIDIVSTHKITRNYSLVVEIPIGTADPVASREALSLDYDTKTLIRELFNKAEREVEEQVLAKVAAAGPGRVSIAMANAKYAEILQQLNGSDNVSLIADKVGHNTDRIPGDFVENAFYYGKSQNARSQRWSAGTQRYVSSLPVLSLPRITIFVVDQDVKMVRKAKRIQNANVSGHTFVLDVPPAEQAKAIRWIKKCWELKPEQFVKASTLPDCPPPRQARGPKAPPRVLAPGQFWQSRRDQHVVSKLGWGDRGTYFPDKMVQYASVLGITLRWEDIFWVNERDEIKWTASGMLPDDRRLDNYLIRKMGEKVAKLPLDEAQTRIEVERQVGSYNSALPVVLAEFFPDVKMDGFQAKQVWNVANISGLDLSNRPILAKVKARIQELSDEFPLLFQKSGEDHFKQYVEAIRATTVKS